MPKYRVMCKKYGWADIEAESEEEAIDKAEAMSDRELNWADAEDHDVVGEAEE